MCVHSVLVHTFKLIASPLSPTMVHQNCLSSQAYCSTAIIAPIVVLCINLLYCTRVYTSNLVLLQFALLHIEYKKEPSTGTAADPSAQLMAYHYCLVNRLAPRSRLAGSPCFGIVIIGCMLWWASSLPLGLTLYAAAHCIAMVVLTMGFAQLMLSLLEQSSRYT